MGLDSLAMVAQNHSFKPHLCVQQNPRADACHSGTLWWLQMSYPPTPHIPVHVMTNQPIYQPTNLPTNQFITQPTSCKQLRNPINEPTELATLDLDVHIQYLVRHRTNQPINLNRQQLSDELTNKLTNWWIHQPANQLASQPTNQPTGQPAINQPANHPATVGSQLAM